MERDKHFRELISLPPEGRRQVAKLIALLKKRYAQSSSRTRTKRSPLRNEKFVGMWKDREDLTAARGSVHFARANG